MSSVSNILDFKAVLVHGPCWGELCVSGGEIDSKTAQVALRVFSSQPEQATSITLSSYPKVRKYTFNFYVHSQVPRGSDQGIMKVASDLLSQILPNAELS